MKTTRYGLKKPDDTDFYNVKDSNDNMDVIDEELGKREAKTNKVTALSSASTDDQYPSAKCVYDAVNGRYLTQTNVSVARTAWASDTTYADFGYRASVPFEGCTAEFVPNVIFSAADAMSGIFAPVAEAVSGAVYIYASENPEAGIVIPVIELRK